jgi:hypothetical protein
MTRKEANLFILAKITRYVNMYPDMRFGQALRNLGVVVDFQKPSVDPGDWNPVEWTNHFNEESTSMLKRMEQTEKKNKLT